MYQWSYEMPLFWKMKLSQESKRCLNFISERVGENAIMFTTTVDNHRLDKEYTLTITDKVGNPIDIIMVTQSEMDSYHHLLFPTFY